MRPSIVIRIGKIVWKAAGSSITCGELEFLKILVPRLPQHTSNVNSQCAGKSEWSKQQYSLYVTSLLEH